ncbi:MAG TPA: folylpolyglutamate synthase/dihydrofolate synthase family protein [Gemmatimonadales bacterium]|nr:folylpolyglutamate synthase/dihydrofolate synthase family protein [Gemmatimonadales bacterium]
MATAYADALAFLFPRVTTIKFGLDTTRALLAAVGDPHTLVPAVHVGGTNGKGSVATLVASALREAGWRVGLYTSPHLVSFRERIRVDGTPISEEAVAMWTERLRPLVEELGGTFFEATTAIAFADFAARGAEIAVVEVGLGGRLDSTNVVRPLVSAVTKIELDHMKYLGDTLESIAGEKAGIAKPGVPFVIGESRPAIVEVLKARGAGYVEAAAPGAALDARVVPPDAIWRGPLGLAGPHQHRNAAVAAATLAALPERWRPDDAAVARGFARAFIPGRLDRRGRWLFDVAHNPDGMRTLVAALAAEPPPGPLHALVSILGDKEWPEMLVTLDRAVDRGILTLAPTAAGRGWNLEWLERWLRDPSRPPARAQWTLVPDFHEALRQAPEGAGTVLVTGSFHTVGDAMARLQVDPLAG